MDTNIYIQGVVYRNIKRRRSGFVLFIYSPMYSTLVNVGRIVIAMTTIKLGALCVQSIFTKTEQIYKRQIEQYESKYTYALLISLAFYWGCLLIEEGMFTGASSILMKVGTGVTIASFILVLSMFITSRNIKDDREIDKRLFRLLYILLVGVYIFSIGFVIKSEELLVPEIKIINRPYFKDRTIDRKKIYRASEEWLI